MIVEEVDVKSLSPFLLTDTSVRQIEKNINLGPVSYDFVIVKKELPVPFHGWWHVAIVHQTQLCSKISCIPKVMQHTS